MARSTMVDLIARISTLINSNDSFNDDDIELVLDDHAFELSQVPLIPTPPFYKKHTSPFGNLEIGAIVYVGYNTELTEDEDYIIDLQRGIVTTPAAEYRGLFLQGTAYDVFGAAADLWERIASLAVARVDVASGKVRSARSQELEHALKMADHYRAKAWAKTTMVRRSDTTGRGTRAEQLLDGFRRSYR